MENNQELERLKQENNRLKSELEWYSRTYENRSYLGLQKEFIKRKNKRLIAALLRTNYIQKKYVISHILSYINKFGFIQFFKTMSGIVKYHGFKSVSRYRNIILKELIIYEAIYEKSVLDYKINSTNAYDLEQIKADMKNFRETPKISFIMPVYNTKLELLKIAIESICKQIYTNWEFCIVDDCSPRQDVRALLNEYKNDKRFKIKFLERNSGISDSSNEALKLTTGDFVALMDHDDEITPDALYWIVKEINERPDADIVYTDECKVDENGNLSDPFLKPDWSPELMYNMMYVGHLTVYRKSLLDKQVGYFRKEFDYSQDYDLMLRATEKARGIYHVKRILYHWRMTQGSAAQGDKPFARQTNLAALGAAMKRRNIDAEIIELPTANRAKINFNKKTLVSIIIPTDSFDNLKTAIESIDANTSYQNYDIIAVTNSGLIKKMESLALHPRLLFEPYDKPYNFSDKCNQGVKRSEAEIAIIFNDDVRPLKSDWLENTIEFLFVEGVGGVSPKLLYENNTIQYAGMATSVRRLVGTTFHCFHRDSTNYINFPQLVRNVSILSGACLAIRKKVFMEIGGFDAINTPIMGSDVELSLKLLEKGLRCVYTPYAELLHIGHLSLKEHDKKPRIKKDKSDIYFLKKWVKYFSEDKYFTDPMRNLLYHDSPEPFKLYTPLKQNTYGTKGDVLLISHDLSQSGAPILLWDLCRILLSEGYFVTVFCPVDGIMRKAYQEIGVPIIVDELVLRQHDTFFDLAKNFDLIICNTVITWPVVKQLQDIVKTIWWVHEAQIIKALSGNHEFIETLRHAKNITTASNYSMSYIKEYYTDNITKILYGCDDSNAGGPVHNIITKDKKIIFSIVGSIEGRKGQDVLIDALNYLSEDELKRMEIWIIGRTLDPGYREMLNDKIGKNQEVIKFKGEIKHTECIELMKQTDIIVCPSRDDPFPTVLVEGFCMGKLCITSTCTGTVELIKEGENGFVFKSEDPKDLADKISIVLKNENKINAIGSKARETFQQNFRMDDYTKKWINYIEN